VLVQCLQSTVTRYAAYACMQTLCGLSKCSVTLYGSPTTAAIVVVLILLLLLRLKLLLARHLSIVAEVSRL
jgi:hypothetical protein